MNEEKKRSLLIQAKDLPRSSGCYLLKRKDGKILYVGKAKNLRSRVSSYFNDTVKVIKTQIMLGHTDHFDFLLTQTETEAFILESHLIKKHTPKYNILMRDDKSYPYVIVDTENDFPRLEYARRVVRDKKKQIFGPFPSGSSIGDVIRILNKTFNLRDCTEREFSMRKEPCILHQMHQCSAPCVDKILKENYMSDLQLAVNFFEGKGDKSLALLREKMKDHAKKEEFEQAILIRDNSRILERFMDSSRQKNVEIAVKKDVDIAAYSIGDVEVDIAIYMIRNGLLISHKNFHFPVMDFREDKLEEVQSCLLQYYNDTKDSLPGTLVVSFDKNKLSFLKKVFKESENLNKIKLISPGRIYKSLFDLADQHAREQGRMRLNFKQSEYLALSKLGELLKMRERPVLLECFDVAVWQGSSPTASRIVFRNGLPIKNDYRYYHLKTRLEGNNDFAMMKEVLERRLKQKGLPDVFLVDGGKGQVNIFLAVLKEYGYDIPVVGIAKAKKDKEERLIIPNRKDPWPLVKHPALLRIIVNMRDEAHRFSRKLHHKEEIKRLLPNKR